VIDAGPRGIVPRLCLNHFGVREIEALIVSHNDDDHWGGAVQIIQKYPRNIRNLYFLEDRPNPRNRLLDIVQREVAEENLPQPKRLEADSTEGKCLFRDEDRAVSLHVLFPWMLANIDARNAGGSNKTSAVLALQCGRKRILFGGDLGIEGWRQLRGALKRPILCTVLAVPHHGGGVATVDQAENHRWMYKEAVRCDFAIISVGTANQYGHPRADHVRALREAGATILCTQITDRCCSASVLETLRPGVITPSVPGASSAKEQKTSSARRSKNVACAGSILAEIGPDHLRLHRLGDHQGAVDDLASRPDGHPLCREP